MAIGKVGSNGTLNENGAFYSAQDVNTLLENVGSDLPTPTVSDAGKAVVVDEEGKYSLDNVGGSSNMYVYVTAHDEDEDYPTTIDSTGAQILEAIRQGINVYIIDRINTQVQIGESEYGNNEINNVYHLDSYNVVTNGETIIGLTIRFIRTYFYQSAPITPCLSQLAILSLNTNAVQYTNRNLTIAS